MVKKNFAFPLALILAFVLSSCGSGGGDGTMKAIMACSQVNGLINEWNRPSGSPQPQNWDAGEALSSAIEYSQAAAALDSEYRQLELQIKNIASSAKTYDMKAFATALNSASAECQRILP